MGNLRAENAERICSSQSLGSLDLSALLKRLSSGRQTFKGIPNGRFFVAFAV
jgi:hypothetical protein